MIPDRRLPGTLALALTNATAAFLLADPARFAAVSYHRYATNLLPPAVWGGLFALSAVLLLAAVTFRKWRVFNVGAGLSLFVWTFLSVAAVAASVRGGDYLSPVAYALFVWMFLGQAAMLFAPLTVEHLEGDV